MNRMVCWTALIAVVVWAGSCFYRSYDEPARIVFVRNIGGFRQIVTVNDDGGDEKIITSSAANHDYPSWSSNGESILFTRAGSIYSINSDGSREVKLTPGNLDYSATWSPDGKKIAFETSRDGNFEVYVMNADGTGQTNMTNHAGADSSPTWLPGGTKIAFVSDRDGDRDVYQMNADGTGPVNLTNTIFDEFSPSWSPDGRKIAYQVNDDIYVMNADGMGQTNITNSALPSQDFRPTWFPDGSRLVFSNQLVPGQRNIFIINPDGTGLKQITFMIEDEDYPCTMGKPR